MNDDKTLGKIRPGMSLALRRCNGNDSDTADCRNPFLREKVRDTNLSACWFPTERRADITRLWGIEDALATSSEASQLQIEMESSMQGD